MKNKNPRSIFDLTKKIKVKLDKDVINYIKNDIKRGKKYE